MSTDFPTAVVGSSQGPTATVEKSPSASNVDSIVPLEQSISNIFSAFKELAESLKKGLA